jgi:hypothetical protein
VLDGEQKRRLRHHDDARARNYEFAGLISYAHHNPQKMPKFEPTGAPKVSDELAHEQVRGFFIGMALRTGRGSKG